MQIFAFDVDAALRIVGRTNNRIWEDSYSLYFDIEKKTN